MPKRRRKYTWFPVRGTGALDGATVGDNFNQQFFELNIPPNGDSVVGINPVVPDVPLEGDSINVDAPGQLSQALGQEYIIERIVGKLLLSVQAPADDVGVIFPKTMLIGAGFFVARSNDEDVGGGVNTPIGSATLAEQQEHYSPLSEETIREPWMWRRVWILNTGRPNAVAATQPNAFGANNTQLAGTGLSVTAGAPPTNIQHSSALDGPHFDVKSVRRVGNDERLFFAVAARCIDRMFTVNQGTNQVLTGGVAGVLDFRVLGALRKANNRSTF